MGVQTSSSNANIQQNCFGNHPYCKKTHNKKLVNDIMKDFSAMHTTRLNETTGPVSSFRNAETFTKQLKADVTQELSTY